MPRKKTEEPITTEETAVLQPADAVSYTHLTLPKLPKPVLPQKLLPLRKLLLLPSLPWMQMQRLKHRKPERIPSGMSCRTHTVPVKSLPEIWVVSKKWKAAAPLPLFTIRRCEW